MSARESRLPRPILASLALIPTLILIAGPLVLGGPAQRAYQDLLADALDTLPTGWVVFEHYDRGWFSSSAHAELALQPKPGETLGAPLHIRLDSRVEQGPLQWFTPRFPPILARVKTRIELIDLPVDLPPLLVTTDIQTNGRTHSKLRIPAGDRPGSNQNYRLRNGLIDGTLEWDPISNRIQSDIQISSLELVGPNGAVVSIEDIALSADLSAWIGALHTGRSQLTLGSAHMGTSAGGSSVKGAIVELTQTPHGDAMDLRLDLSVDSLETGGRNYQKAALGLAVEGIDGTTLSELSEGLNALSSGAVSPAMRGLVGAALMARLLPRLIAAQPRVILEPLEIQTPDGPVSARLRLASTGHQDTSPGSDAPFADFSSWLTHLTGEGAITLPETTAQDWLGSMPSDSTGSSASKHPSSQPDKTPLQPLIEDGWVSLQNEKVSTSFLLSDGLFTINGKSIALSGAAAPAIPQGTAPP